MAADLADRRVGAQPGSSRLARVLGAVMLALLVALAVEVLLEAWVQEILGDRYIRPDDVLRGLGGLEGHIPDWPKDLKNGLLVALVLTSLAKVAVERRWREFSTRADLAFTVLTLIMILAGLFGTSGPLLIVQALFVYFRGAIVFYAIRALRPSWDAARWLLWAVGGVLAVSTLVALVQMVAGWSAYSGVGWVDPRYFNEHRAQGLFDHPNHLGHVLGVALIGLLAWMSGRTRNTWQWWAVFAFGALGLAATVSRESMIATLVGGLLVWFLRRRGGRTIIIGGLVVALLFLGNMLVRPENFKELAFRLRGVVSAVETPSGTENCEGYKTIEECTKAGAAPSREIRALFFQQGAVLLSHRPFLGYGVGQFGGVVAEQNDPDWEKDPRFGPGGFKLYDFTGTTVDSFWLHLTVEVGLLGLAAYLIWLYLLIAPLWRQAPRFRRGPPAHEAEAPAEVAEASGVWAIGSAVFAVLVAALSPALEDPLFPPLVFGVVGLAWVLGGVRGGRRVPDPDSEGQTGTQVT